MAFRAHLQERASRGPPIVAAVALAIFVVSAIQVEAGPVGPDATILLGFESARSPFWNRVMVGITDFGAGLPVFFLTVFVALGVSMRGHFREALFLIVSALGSELLTVGAKRAFARARPSVELVSRVTESGGFAFPSGHALGAMVLYTSVAMVAVEIGRASWKRAAIALAVIMIPTMGITRVYLGVHYPSDVVAGWSLGAAWVWALYWVYLATHPRA